MAGVLAVKFGAVWELSLQGLSENWVERLVLTATHIDATSRKRNNQL